MMSTALSEGETDAGSAESAAETGETDETGETGGTDETDDEKSGGFFSRLLGR